MFPSSLRKSKSAVYFVLESLVDLGFNLFGQIEGSFGLSVFSLRLEVQRSWRHSQYKPFQKNHLGLSENGVPQNPVDQHFHACPPLNDVKLIQTALWLELLWLLHPIFQHQIHPFLGPPDGSAHSQGRPVCSPGNARNAHWKLKPEVTWRETQRITAYSVPGHGAGPSDSVPRGDAGFWGTLITFGLEMSWAFLGPKWILLVDVDWKLHKDWEGKLESLKVCAILFGAVHLDFIRLVRDHTIWLSAMPELLWHLRLRVADVAVIHRYIMLYLYTYFWKSPESRRKSARDRTENVSIIFSASAARWGPWGSWKHFASPWWKHPKVSELCKTAKQTTIATLWWQQWQHVKLQNQMPFKSLQIPSMPALTSSCSSPRAFDPVGRPCYKIQSSKRTWL